MVKFVGLGDNVLGAVNVGLLDLEGDRDGDGKGERSGELNDVKVVNVVEESLSPVDGSD